MAKRNNQAIRKFAVKHDTEELVELGQFIREAFPQVKVEREWYILFTQGGRLMRVQSKRPKCSIYRTPDLMIFEKLEGNKKGKLICCLEVDGRIHDIHVVDTMERDQQYGDAGIPLVVINKSYMKKISIFDEAYNKLLPLIK